MNKKVVLIIMDGWGLGKVPTSDAIQQANVPFVSSLYNQYPNTTLLTCGEAVGLPEGQMGNSEVGHLNIGAGRVVYQELQRIHVAIRDGSFFSNPVLLDTLNTAKSNNKSLHLIGLLGDGGVHAHTDHLKAICDLCKKQELNRVYLHLFTDGRDTDPKSGKAFITDLEAYLKHSTGEIASISGRYYAMDRDKRWERIQLAYNCLVKGEGQIAKDALTAIENAYHSGTTDEFILPTNIISNSGAPKATIQEGDAVICFNFRTDRCREITSVLTQKDFPEFGMKKLALTFTTMTQYDQTFQQVNVIFENDNLNNTLGEVLSDNGKRQIRIAETEKYPHVTFFFNGGREDPFPGENRIMVASPKVATYDLQPEMSALEVKDKICAYIQEKKPDFICLNFANPDMVGHTGVYQAIVKAVETVDSCLKEVVETGQELGYEFLVIADHGNADYALNADGSPNTAHSMNPVPAVLVTKDASISLKSGKLADVAPTILDRMGIQQPVEMNGKSLLK